MKLNLQLFGGRGASSINVESGWNREESRILKKYIKSTANLKNEQYRIIDANGNVLIKKQGEEHQVSITTGEKREYLDGNISLHNHPNGGTFSADDIRDFGFGAKEIVISTPEGQYRLINTNYGTRKEKDGWLDFQRGLEKVQSEEMNFRTLQDKANEYVRTTDTYKRYERLGKEVMNKKNTLSNEEFRKWVDATKEEYDNAYKEVQSLRAKEMRRIETQSSHNYIKKNARKYGFKYVTNNTLYR